MYDKLSFLGVELLKKIFFSIIDNINDSIF